MISRALNLRQHNQPKKVNNEVEVENVDKYKQENIVKLKSRSENSKQNKCRR